MLYQWLLYWHLASVAGFLLAHGSAGAMALVLRRQQGADRIRALLDLSTLSAPLTYVFLVLIIATGVALGIAGHWWASGRIWVSLALLIVTSGAMVGLGIRYNAVRMAADSARPSGNRNLSPTCTARGASAGRGSHPTRAHRLGWRPCTRRAAVADDPKAVLTRLPMRTGCESS